MSLEAGSRVGRYEIVGPLGKGGMGEVYRARDTRLGREVAIKVMSEVFDALIETSSRERFESEARSISALRHPNIVTLYDIGQEGELPYLVMELIEGRTLRQDLGQPMPAERAVDLAAQIAGALAAAHRKGISHRDLKPENVLIDDDGQAKVLDFGLSRWVSAEEGSNGSIAETRTRLTRPGAVLGTVGYMSPEMVGGRDSHAPGDQFALGCILYEMLAGGPAFTGESAAEILASVLRDQPRNLGSAASNLPPALVALVERCLAKAPESRFPSADSLCDELRAIAAALATPPPPTRVRRRGSLPARRTRFFGRERELEEIGELLSDPVVRLLTLTGGGGTGKTRLALQVADILTSEFEDRIFFVPLAGLSQADLVGPEIARIVDVQKAGAWTPAEAIADAVEELGGPTLLILDSFEHLADAALLLGDLLDAAPALTLLVTSRELLHVYGEHDYPVSTLPVPGLGSSAPLDELTRQPAIALFVDRAQAARPSFILDSDNAAEVAVLCARLDGLPLALELAAARVRMLSPKDLVVRLARRLEVLTSGARDLPDRQRTLRGTIDWSHDLLNEEEQTVFRRLAVFPGGFTLEGAESVVDALGNLGLGITEAIGSLVDKSLVRQLAAAGEPRFSFLETMREYALERLAMAGDEDETRRAHAAYFLVLAEEGAAALGRGEDAEWLETFAREHDNFLAALDWLAATDNAEWALRVALGVFNYWERAELFSMGARRLRGLLELPSAAAHDALRAKGSFATGVLVGCGGDREHAVEMYRASLEMHQRLDDRWGVLVALNALSLGLSDLSRFEEAKSHQEQAKALAAELGDDVAVARSLSNLARIAMGYEDHDEARRCYREAAEIFSRLEDRLGWAWSLNHEGDVARSQQDLAGAAELYDEALIAFRKLDDSWGIASSLADLGRIRRLHEDWTGAADLFKRALRRFADLGHRRGVARVIEQMSIVAAEEGNGETALRLAGAAAAIRNRLGFKDAKSPDAKELDDCLGRLSDVPGDAGDRAMLEGEAMPWRAAVEYALEEDG